MSDTFTNDHIRHFLDIGPYPLEAFEFVREGLSYTASQVHLEAGDPYNLDRHVSGQELCLGLRDFAIQRYGLMARTVLECWRVHRTEDFGRIVYAMIQAGFFAEQPDDTIDDFVNVFDFREAFDPRDIESRIGTPQPG
ncbi:MAG: hypothetical protein QF561_00775 [Phycisphaerales bacterium]|jgi:uncharacterized repeat protein (TIGR04138 family)|nr:hypothetical protein [Phycisphaerales bacterium]